MNDYTLENFISYCDDMEIAEEGFLENAKKTVRNVLLSIIRKLKKWMSKGKDNSFKSSMRSLLDRAEKLLTKVDNAETEQEVQNVSNEATKISEETDKIVKQAGISDEEIQEYAKKVRDAWNNSDRKKELDKEKDSVGQIIKYWNDGKTPKYAKFGSNEVWYDKNRNTIRSKNTTSDVVYEYYPSKKGKKAIIRHIKANKGTFLLGKTEIWNDTKGETVRYIKDDKLYLRGADNKFEPVHEAFLYDFYMSGAYDIGIAQETYQSWYNMDIAEEGLKEAYDKAVTTLQRNLRNFIIRIKAKVAESKDSKLKSVLMSILTKVQRLLSKCDHLTAEDKAEYNKYADEFNVIKEEYDKAVAESTKEINNDIGEYNKRMRDYKRKHLNNKFVRKRMLRESNKINDKKQDLYDRQEAYNKTYDEYLNKVKDIDRRRGY